MKIAIITSGLLPLPATKGGAIETLIDTLVLENEKYKKLDITIYSISDKESKKQANKNNYKSTKYTYINVLPNLIIRFINKLLRKNIAINTYYQKKVIKLVKKVSYDYIIIENYPELVLQLENKKVIPYIHSDVFNIDTKNCKEILKYCYKVITVSNFIKNRVLDIDKTSINKVVTVYNSIDFDSISKEESDNYRNIIREKYGINNNDFVYAFSGRISKEKGVLELVKAFNKANIPNKKLLIIGGIWYGSKRTNSYLNELQSISGDNIIYTGYVEHKYIKKILCSTDVGVVPSICNEAAGLSVVEFMNTGNVVVAANMGGIKEYLNTEDNYLVEYKNQSQFIDELSLSLEKCYNNKDNISNIKNSNLNFSKKFSIEENYKQIINVLESSDTK